MSILNVLLLLIILVLLYYVVKKLTTTSNLLQNFQDGKTESTVKASALATNADSTNPSNFTYSIWFYINDWNYRYGETKVIFGRMSNDSAQGKDPCPAVTLGSIANNLSVSISCLPSSSSSSSSKEKVTSVIDTCNIDNIPIQKWVNLIVSVNNRTMDLYLEGKLVKTCLLAGIANVNTSEDVYVTPSGGFDGYTARFQYFPNAINPQDAWNMYASGVSSLKSFAGSYKVKITLEQNGVDQKSITI